MSEGAPTTSIVVGAGGDIGAACALRMADFADEVLCVDRDTRRSREVAELVKRSGGRAVSLTADADDSRFVDQIVGLCGAGSVHSVVYAIGYEDDEPAETISLDSIRRSFAIGPLGAFDLFRGLLVGDRLKSGAALTAIGSLHARYAFARAIGYNAAHAALVQIVRSLAHEWAPRRIRVNAVVPGWIRTTGELLHYGVETLDSAAPLLPFGRLGTAQDVASAVAFLCSPDAGYVSGSFLVVDGALSAAQAWLPNGEVL